MIYYAAFSTVGTKQNQINDDRVLLNGSIKAEFEDAMDQEVFAAVFDGVGGEAHGDYAAQLAAEVFSDLGQILTSKEINAGLQQANDLICKKQYEDRAFARMSTTVAGLVLRDTNYIIFNMGDSRVYHLGNYFSQLSVDHTYKRMQQEVTGKIEDLPPGCEHLITRYLGTTDEMNPAITMGTDRVRPGDVFLLCSDGLHDYVSSDVLKKVLMSSSPLFSTCRTLADLAMKNGSPDNISVIICKVV